jgi:hypothetical protein
MSKREFVPPPPKKTNPRGRVSFLTLGTAVLLRWLLDPLMGDALPPVTLFGAVAAAVWLGGYRIRPPSIFYQTACFARASPLVENP